MPVLRPLPPRLNSSARSWSPEDDDTGRFFRRVATVGRPFLAGEASQALAPLIARITDSARRPLKRSSSLEEDATGTRHALDHRLSESDFGGPQPFPGTEAGLDAACDEGLPIREVNIIAVGRGRLEAASLPELVRD